jgi:hypothetical protein
LHRVKQQSTRKSGLMLCLIALAVDFAAMPVLQAQTDTAAPQLVSFDFAPASINVSESAQTVTVTAHITDDGSGLGGGDFRFCSPSFKQQMPGRITPASRVSGTAQDGIYVMQIVIPKASEPGAWSLYSVSVDDLAGNDSSYGGSAGFGFPSDTPASFDVVSTQADVEGSELVEMRFGPKQLDVTTSAQMIKVGARITDSYTGYSGGGFQFRSPSGAQAVSGSFMPDNRTSGTAQDGVYVTTVTMPQSAEVGTWTLYYVYLYDAANNYRGYGPYHNTPYPAGVPTELIVATPVQFSATAYTVSETEAGANVTIVRGGDPAGTATVHCSTSDGTAKAGTDYSSVSVDLTFAPGETSKDINIPILHDGLYEGNQNFTVALSAPVGVLIASPGSTKVTIVDSSGPPTIGFSANTYSLNESGQAVAVTLKKTGATSLPATVHYGTGDGSAKAGPDYGATSGSVTFAPNETAKTVLIPVLQDNIDEPDEYFWVKLSGASGATLPSASALVTILDDDPLPTVQWTAVTYTVQENCGYAVLTAKMVGRKSTPATVHFTTNDGTAEAGKDYHALSGDITFAPGTSDTRTVSIPILDNQLPESTEAFKVTLSGTASAKIGTRSTAAVTINDFDRGAR